MKKSTTNKILLLLVVIVTCLSVTESALKLVLLVHRHGDRNPIKSYPKDPYKKESLWPDGFGELRPEGKARLFKMGRMLRSRYEGFLTDNPREVHVRSSGSDRCLESVSCLLAGCYPPSGRWMWNADLDWQPFPIQTKPRGSDGMLVTTSVCPAAEAEVRRIRESEKMREYADQFKDLFQFLHLNSGANVTDIIEAGNLFDVLRIEKLAGMKLPSWVTDDIMTQLRSILDMTFYFDFSTKLIQRFRSGLLLKDIVTRLKYVMSESKDEPSDVDHVEKMESKKLYLYSSHDTQIAVTLQALGQFNMLAPPYGSSIVFELHETERAQGELSELGSDSNVVSNGLVNNHENRFYLKGFYWNETQKSHMIPLTLPGCEQLQSNAPCPAKLFIQSINEYIPHDWSSECSLSIVDQINSVMFENLVVLTVLGLISVILLILAYICIKHGRNSRKKILNEDSLYEDSYISNEDVTN